MDLKNAKLNNLSVSELEIMQEGTARRIKELQAETLTDYPKVVKEAIMEYLNIMQDRYSRIYNELGNRV